MKETAQLMLVLCYVVNLNIPEINFVMGNEMKNNEAKLGQNCSLFLLTSVVTLAVFGWFQRQY